MQWSYLLIEWKHVNLQHTSIVCKVKGKHNRLTSISVPLEFLSTDVSRTLLGKRNYYKWRNSVCQPLTADKFNSFVDRHYDPTLYSDPNSNSDTTPSYSQVGKSGKYFFSFYSRQCQFPLFHIFNFHRRQMCHNFQYSGHNILKF